MPSSTQAYGFTWIATKFLRFLTAARFAWGAAWACGAGAESQAASAEQSWKKVLRGTAWFIRY